MSIAKNEPVPGPDQSTEPPPDHVPFPTDPAEKQAKSPPDEPTAPLHRPTGPEHPKENQ